MQLSLFSSLDSTNTELKRSLGLSNCTLATVTADHIGTPTAAPYQPKARFDLNLEHSAFMGAVMALEQFQGYGRQARQWASPFGGLYLSCAFTLESLNVHLSTISLICALELACTLEGLSHKPDLLAKPTRFGEVLPTTLPRLAPGDIKLKWPNDILYAGGKLAGISLECTNKTLIIGCGVNVFEPKGSTLDSLFEQGKYTPAFLTSAAAVPSLTDAQKEDTLVNLGGVVLRALCAAYDTWCRSGFAPYRSKYEARMLGLGKRIEAQCIGSDARLSGILEGLNEEGQLIINEDLHGVTPLSSGEIHILTPYVQLTERK